jgi:hypothetical protein
MYPRSSKASENSKKVCSAVLYLPCLEQKSVDRASLEEAVGCYTMIHPHIPNAVLERKVDSASVFQMHDYKMSQQSCAANTFPEAGVPLLHKPNISIADHWDAHKQTGRILVWGRVVRINP